MPRLDIFFQVPPFIKWGIESSPFLSAVAISTNYLVFAVVMLATLAILLASLDFWLFQFRRKKLWIDWDKPEPPFEQQPYDGP